MARLRALALLSIGVALGARLDAATFVVNHTVDLPDSLPGNGVCSAGFGLCTLRAAVMEANADATEDTVQLGVGTYRLTRSSGPDDASFGDLDVYQPLRIRGAEMRATILSAATGERVLELHAGQAVLTRLTLRDGRAAGGAGVRVAGAASLWCERCLIRDNRSSADGGGVEVLADGRADFYDTILGSNLAAGCGGALAVQGIAALVNGRLTRNRALGAGGGACATRGESSLILAGSTVDGNSAGSNGGGLALQAGLHALTNSTLSGNRAIRGGGLHVEEEAGVSGGEHVTIAANQAILGGGGVWNDGGLGLSNSVIGDNLVSGTPRDCLGIITSQHGHNLVEEISGCFFSGTLDGTMTNQDAGLLPLANTGGSHPTHELASADSPLHDAGFAGLESSDQRFYPRPSGAAPDIGATELHGIVPVEAAVINFPFAVGALAVRPTHGNLLADGVDLEGTITDLDGPPGLDYSIDDGDADYGFVDGGTASNCARTDDCYLVSATVPAGQERPLTHLDGEARETAGPARPLWRLHFGPSFADTTDLSAGRAVERLLHGHGTAGCAADRYCPADGLSRRQLALLLERAYWGEFALPFVATGAVFADVAVDDPHAEWIERLAADGVSAGCAADPDGAGPLLPRFCPDGAVRRDQFARALVRMKRGAGFAPPVCESRPFADVQPTDPSCPWILAAAQLGMPGCADDPDGGGSLLASFCPHGAATRSQAAVALDAGFDLTDWSLGL